MFITDNYFCTNGAAGIKTGRNDRNGAQVIPNGALAPGLRNVGRALNYI